ncbi:MAG: hypothetical protein V2J42_12995 [Wenzhouxiangella sp.]|nr:hypothetical protein [Wenzhouxiangella sp.]
MKLTFYVLIFYMLFSIAAGLLMPGDTVGRYALVTAATCSELEDELEAFNPNNVRYRVVSADAIERAGQAEQGMACWLEIRGLPDSGVGDAATPLYDAALRMADGPLSVERAYQPRFGQAETRTIWLVSLLLAVLILFLRRPKNDV